MNWKLITMLLFYCGLSMLIAKKYYVHREYILYISSIFVILYMTRTRLIETMIGGADAVTSQEAIQHIASMYNSDQLIVKNLKVTGNLQVDGDAEIGPAYVGKLGVGYETVAGFGHKKFKGDPYSVPYQQNSAGSVYIQAPNNTGIISRYHDQVKTMIDATGLKTLTNGVYKLLS